MNYWGCWNGQCGYWDHPKSGVAEGGYPIPMALAEAKAHVEASRGSLELAGFGGFWLPMFDLAENSTEKDILEAKTEAEAYALAEENPLAWASASAREYAAESAKKPLTGATR